MLDKKCSFFEGTPYKALGVHCSLCANNAYNGAECGYSMCVIPTTVVNLTPHDVVVLGSDDKVIASYGASGSIARCFEVREYIADFGGIPIHKKSYGEVLLDDEPFPAPTDGVLFIVSGMVKAAMPDRKDLLCPDQLVRDEGGRVIGCRALSM